MVARRAAYALTEDDRHEYSGFRKGGRGTEADSKGIRDSKHKCVFQIFLDDRPVYVPIGQGRESAAGTPLQQIYEGVACLRSIIQHYEMNEADVQSEALLRKVSDNHGEAQSQHAGLDMVSDVGMTTTTIMHKIFQTSLDNPWETVACMIRGVAFPYSFGVSGWTQGRYGTADGPLDRTVWVDKVFKLAYFL